VVRKVIPIELIGFENRYFYMICVNLKSIGVIFGMLSNYQGSQLGKTVSRPRLSHAPVPRVSYPINLKPFVEKVYILDLLAT